MICYVMLCYILFCFVLVCFIPFNLRLSPHVIIFSNCLPFSPGILLFSLLTFPALLLCCYFIYLVVSFVQQIFQLFFITSFSFSFSFTFSFLFTFSFSFSFSTSTSFPFTFTFSFLFSFPFPFSFSFSLSSVSFSTYSLH